MTRCLSAAYWLRRTFLCPNQRCLVQGFASIHLPKMQPCITPAPDRGIFLLEMSAKGTPHFNLKMYQKSRSASKETMFKATGVRLVNDEIIVGNVCKWKNVPAKSGVVQAKCPHAQLVQACRRRLSRRSYVFRGVKMSVKGRGNHPEPVEHAAVRRCGQAWHYIC